MYSLNSWIFLHKKCLIKIALLTTEDGYKPTHITSKPIKDFFPTRGGETGEALSRAEESKSTQPHYIESRGQTWNILAQQGHSTDWKKKLLLLLLL